MDAAQLRDGTVLVNAAHVHAWLVALTESPTPDESTRRYLADMVADWEEWLVYARGALSTPTGRPIPLAPWDNRTKAPR